MMTYEGKNPGFYRPSSVRDYINHYYHIINRVVSQQTKKIIHLVHKHELLENIYTFTFPASIKALMVAVFITLGPPQALLQVINPPLGPWL